MFPQECEVLLASEFNGLVFELRQSLRRGIHPLAAVLVERAVLHNTYLAGIVVRRPIAPFTGLPAALRKPPLPHGLLNVPAPFQFLQAHRIINRLVPSAILLAPRLQAPARGRPGDLRGGRFVIFQLAEVSPGNRHIALCLVFQDQVGRVGSDDPELARQGRHLVLQLPRLSVAPDLVQQPADPSRGPEPRNERVARLLPGKLHVGSELLLLPLHDPLDRQLCVTVSTVAAEHREHVAVEHVRQVPGIEL